MLQNVFKVSACDVNAHLSTVLPTTSIIRQTTVPFSLTAVRNYPVYIYMSLTNSKISQCTRCAG